MVISIADDLQRVAKGEVLHDNWSRKIYSVDSSNYTLTPLAAVHPSSEIDLENICQYCFLNNIPITPRGAATGLLGQCLSDGVILDFTKHMNRITEIEENYVVVQPGLVKGVLDKELSKKAKFFPPDPASGNYCTIGGMIANNSSGAHALGYGNTIDFLQEVNVVYSDGSTGFASYKKNKFDGRMSKLLKILSPSIDLIQEKYPKVTKNSCGYRLDAVINSQRFSPQKVFAASEGTLGLVTSARLKILDIPLFQYLLVLSFENLLSAVSAVPIILEFRPVALEMLDHTAFSSITSATAQYSNYTGCLLFLEFAGDNLNSVERKVRFCKNKLLDRCNILEVASDEVSRTKIWAARKNALNYVLKLTVGSRKAIGLIEDTVINPNLLSYYTRYLLQMYLNYRMDYVIYGHVGNGNLHTRPFVDTNGKNQVELMKHIATQVFKTVITLGGTITGEHGDGLARAKYIQSVYGKEIFSMFKIIKKLFDPTYIMNPGKKIVQQDKINIA